MTMWRSGTYLIATREDDLPPARLEKPYRNLCEDARIDGTELIKPCLKT
jgi:hypothetical protein